MCVFVCMCVYKYVSEVGREEREREAAGGDGMGAEIFDTKRSMLFWLRV